MDETMYFTWTPRNHHRRRKEEWRKRFCIMDQLVILRKFIS